MAVVGTATLNITPKFPGLTQAIQSELNKAAGNTSVKAGESFGTGFGQGASSGLAKSGAIVGAFSAITSSAMQSISSHVGEAVSRFDTLNNYPIVMQNLGYSSESADASITKMSDHLQGLPTALDSVVSTVQGIVAVTGDLDQATDVGLALNDMLLASGSNQQLVNAAMEQFRQMLSKGKPELQDWKSLTSAMPGQMQQLAQALLGSTANANDLYTALGGGGAEATITMDQLLAKIIELDQTGGESFASFEEQARTATGGVATSAANMGTAITRGIADVFDAIGKENISGVFSDLTEGINVAAESVSGIVSTITPAIKGVYDVVKGFAPEILTAGAAFMTFSKATPAVTGLAAGAKSLFEAMQLTKGGAGSFAESIAAVGLKINPVTAGLTAAAVVVGVVGTALIEAQQNAENFETATKGLSDVVNDTTGLDEYSGVITDIGSSASGSAKSVDELYESMAGHVQTMQETTAEAQNQIAQLNTAQSIINQYAGVTDLTAQAQGRLEWALQQVNEQFGLSLTATDVAANAYSDAQGNVLNLRDSINQLIEAKKQEIKLDATKENLTEAYEAEAEAAKAAAQARLEYNKAIEDTMQQTGWSREQTLQNIDNGTALVRQTQNLRDAEQAAKDASANVNKLEQDLGDIAVAASDSADAWDQWGNSLSQSVIAQVEAGGNSLADLKEDLRSLSASAEDLGTLTEDQLIDLAMAYDGTSSSIVGKLQEWGVQMDEAAANAAKNSASIKDALYGLGDEVKNALSSSNVDIDAFSQKLAEAGVSAEQLNAIGSENLASLAESCQGNTDQMVWCIQNWNNVPMIDKDGNVTVDDESLIDAQGNLWTWNGTTFVNKDGNAIVNDTSLRDAQGRLYNWNGSRLESKSATVTITQVLKTVGNAAGGVISSAVNNAFNSIKWATGGVVRKHADGFIATSPTMISPNDMIGENGAEAYTNVGGNDYIVPLTNKKYSQPFIDLLADGVTEKLRGKSVNYYIGDITLDVSSLKDLSTIEEFVNMVIRTKGAR